MQYIILQIDNEDHTITKCTNTFDNKESADTYIALMTEYFSPRYTYYALKESA